MRGVKHRWLNPLQKQLVFRCNQIVHAEYPFIIDARPTGPRFARLEDRLLCRVANPCAGRTGTYIA
jgi:hypothetical protein